jgi:hypothetical protein
MRGYEHSNFPAFDAAAERLRALGYTVISPADHDREIGFDGDRMTNGSGLEAFPMKEAILWDLQQVADCDMVYLLPGWEKSSGAAVEMALARFLDKTILDSSNFSSMLPAL